MGIRFRKSINLGGGFRINLSKSGVGYSWGVPGYRTTRTTTGKKRKTYSIPGTGISYVDETGRKKSNAGDQKGKEVYNQNDNLYDYSEVASADIDNFQAAEYADVIKKIKTYLILNRLSSILIIFLLLIFSPGNFYFLILGILGVISKIIIHLTLHIDFTYEMDEYSKEKYIERISAWKSLNSANKLWQIINTGKVRNSKITAGAGRLINRRKITISSKKPFYIKTESEIVILRLNKEKLILMPDKILIIRGTKVGAEDYKKVSVNLSEVRFIENGSVPKDALIVDKTWQYVNKNGTADKRYKNNRQLPVCKYGKIEISSNSGINVELQCSNYKLTDALNNLI